MWKPIFQTLQHLGGRERNSMLYFLFRVHYSCKFEFFIILENFSEFIAFSGYWTVFIILSVKIPWPVKSVVYDGWISERCRTKTGPLQTGLKSGKKFNKKKRVQLYFCNHKNLASFTRFLLVFYTFLSLEVLELQYHYSFTVFYCSFLLQILLLQILFQLHGTDLASCKSGFWIFFV